MQRDVLFLDDEPRFLHICCALNPHYHSNVNIMVKASLSRTSLHSVREAVQSIPMQLIPAVMFLFPTSVVGFK